ncbi:CoA-binding protein [soil metagenome]
MSPIADIREILERSDSVATVGASANPNKPAGGVPQYLKSVGFHVIPVNPNAPEIFGEKSFASLLDVDEPVDIVQVFRPSEEVPDVARQAVQIGAKVLWLQLGITSPEARAIADKAGIEYVEDRCMERETRRLRIRKGSTESRTDRAS